MGLSKDHHRALLAWLRLKVSGKVEQHRCLDDWIAANGAPRRHPGRHKDIAWPGRTRLVDLTPAQARCVRRRLNGWRLGMIPMTFFEAKACGLLDRRGARA